MSSLVETRLGTLAAAGELLALSCADKTMLAVGTGALAATPVVRACAFAPFGDVYRSDVAAAARKRNAVSPVIPAGCLARLRVPTGLGLEQAAQTDELRLSELDALLLLHIERGAGVGELAGSRLGEQGVALAPSGSARSRRGAARARPIPWSRRARLARPNGRRWTRGRTARPTRPPRAASSRPWQTSSPSRASDR